MRIVYKEWPILGSGSEFAARAALAARRQGKYQAFHDALMRADDRVEEASVLDIAAAIGLDTERLREDMQAPEIAETLKHNWALATDLGIAGTPSFVIGDRLLRGAAGNEVITGLIRQAREE